MSKLTENKTCLSFMQQTEANELLRSAYTIACREGIETDWLAFRKWLEKVLLEQSIVFNNTKHLSLATYTPKMLFMPKIEKIKK